MVGLRLWLGGQLALFCVDFLLFLGDENLLMYIIAHYQNPNRLFSHKTQFADHRPPIFTHLTVFLATAMATIIAVYRKFKGEDIEYDERNNMYYV